MTAVHLSEQMSLHQELSKHTDNAFLHKSENWNSYPISLEIVIKTFCQTFTIHFQTISYLLTDRSKQDITQNLQANSLKNRHPRMTLFIPVISMLVLILK